MKRQFVIGLELVLLLAIVALAGYLRLANVGTNPAWYTDEATHVDIARNLMHGEMRHLAINQSTLLFVRPPLFHLLLAGVFSVTDAGMAALRGFTGTLGVLTVILLYGITRRMLQNAGFALLAALLLATYPQAVLYSRMGFSYNLLAPLVLLVVFGLWRYTDGDRRGLALAAFCVGVGIVSDLAIGTVALPLLVVVLWRRWHDTLWSVPLMLLPFGMYAAIMLLRAPDAFRFDFAFTFGRLSNIPPIQQPRVLADNYTVLLSQDFWFPAGIIGLFMLESPRLRSLSLLVLLLPLAMMGRTVALHDLSAYYMIPLLPLVVLGVAGLLCRGVPAAAEMTHAGLSRWRLPTRVVIGLAWGMTLLVAVTPLLVTVEKLVDYTRNGWPTAIAPFLINATDARAVSDFVNGETKVDDVVIASTPVAILLNAHAADFQMAVVAGGDGAVHLPADLPPERFVFDARYEQAKFVIIDNLWRNWGMVHIPAVLAIAQDVEANWTLAYEAGALRVYRNPVAINVA